MLAIGVSGLPADRQIFSAIEQKTKRYGRLVKSGSQGRQTQRVAPVHLSRKRLGWRLTWQRSRQALHRWSRILSTAYALPQLLSMYCHEQMRDLMLWRHAEKRRRGPPRRFAEACGCFSAVSGCETGGIRYVGNSSPAQPLKNRTIPSLQVKNAWRWQAKHSRAAAYQHHDD